ncbi:hypothetical protein PCCS19_50000 [Paenibacillus sp. CCS19]|uniref:hypothetical protein n=1 Tax=Paenibacillus sp. CCS19 TaxID=3158387 RepID=UPI00256334F4|nr:hypothetical protein [Paenibacillus cellulosilyticus]GMK41941.1 hypothetical protein PCCS19_50000 [Paenibacillus cellulosilyticus]
MKMVQGIVLADNEVVIRQYEASALDVPKAEGFVIVTNRRVIFTGSSQSITGSGLIIRDAKIDSVTGVMAGLMRHRSFKLLIFGAILGLIGLIMTINNSSIISWLMLVVGAICIYNGLRSKGILMYISILGAQTSSALSVTVEKSTLFSRVKGNDALMTVTAAGPGRNTEQMLRELGALIQDVQIMGDHALDKWRNIPMTSGSFEAVPVSEQFASTIDAVKNTVSKVKDTTVNTAHKQQQLNNQENSTFSNERKNTCDCGSTYEKDDVFCPQCGARAV